MFSVNISGRELVIRNARALDGYVRRAIAEANQITADEMVIEAQRILVANDTIASGDLYNSLETETAHQGLTVMVGSTAKYAPFVEFGTQPHFPPPAAIARWCRFKGIPESAVWPICLKIARDGTQEQPFLWPAYRQAMRRHFDRARTMIAAALRQATT